MDKDIHTGEREKLPSDGSSESQPLTARYQSSKGRREFKPSARASMNFTVTKQPKKTTTLMSVTRLQIPSSGGYQRLDNSPLLNLESDSDEDELFLSYATPTAKEVNRQLTKQLEKDGYRLDEVPDDEELDLIPPREFREPRFVSCCNAFNISCAIM